LFGHLLDIGRWWPPNPTLNTSQRRDLVERLFNMRAEDVPLVQELSVLLHSFGSADSHAMDER
jgi:hypothetical protein